MTYFIGARKHSSVSKNAGFTLLEVMIAISIFSFIGLASWQMLKSTSNTNQRLTEADAKIFRLQKAFSIISSDFAHLISRPIRDELGDPHGALTSLKLDELIGFTRMNGTFFAGDEKLLVQRISYALEETDDSQSFSNGLSNSDRDSVSLYRYLWPVLDLVEPVEPQKQLLLPNIGQVNFQFYDQNGEIHSDWPYEVDVDSSEYEIELARALAELPTGIHISIESEDFGTVDRLFARTQVSIASDK